MKIDNQFIRFLADNGITHVHNDHDTRVGVAEFMFTNALVTDYDRLTANVHRFCYPSDKYSVTQMIDLAKAWDGQSLPPDGWVKYKGVLGEFGTNESQTLRKLMENQNA